MAGITKKAKGAKASWAKARRLAKKLGIGVSEARSRASEKKPLKRRATEIRMTEEWSEGALVLARTLINSSGGADKAKEAIDLVERLRG